MGGVGGIGGPRFQSKWELGAPSTNSGAPSSIPSEHPIATGFKTLGKGLLLGLAALGSVAANAFGVVAAGFLLGGAVGAGMVGCHDAASGSLDLIGNMMVGPWALVGKLKNYLFG